MIDVIMANMGAIGTGLVAVILIIYALVTRQWMILRSAALSLMLSAEKLMSTTEGRKKMDWVLANVWQRTPRWLKAYMTEDRFRTKLQEWYNAARGMISE